MGAAMPGHTSGSFEDFQKWAHNPGNSGGGSSRRSGGGGGGSSGNQAPRTPQPTPPPTMYPEPECHAPEVPSMTKEDAKNSEYQGTYRFPENDGVHRCVRPKCCEELVLIYPQFRKWELANKVYAKDPEPGDYFGEVAFQKYQNRLLVTASGRKNTTSYLFNMIGHAPNWVVTLTPEMKAVDKVEWLTGERYEKLEETEDLGEDFQDDMEEMEEDNEEGGEDSRNEMVNEVETAKENEDFELDRDSYEEKAEEKKSKHE